MIISEFRNVDKARLYTKGIYAISVGNELVQTTNSTKLTGVGAEFKTDLANLLASPSWPMLDRPQTDGTRGSIRLVLTNEQHQALHMQLQGDFASGEWRFRLLSYQKTDGRDGATNRSLPIVR
jgi:hypothetical protein